MTRLGTHLPTLIVVLLAFGTAPAVAQVAAVKGGFVVKKGNDTVAIETYSRDGSTLTSEIRQTNGIRTQLTLTLGHDERVKYVELIRQGRQGQPFNASIAFGDTLVSVSLTGPGGESESADMPSRGQDTPFLAVSFALCEQILRASHLDVGQSRKWTAYRLGAGDTTSLTVTRFHADSALFSTPDVQLKVAMSSTGQVVGGRHLGQDWLIQQLR